jgi:hypothetical protein
VVKRVLKLSERDVRPVGFDQNADQEILGAWMTRMGGNQSPHALPRLRHASRVDEQEAQLETQQRVVGRLPERFSERRESCVVLTVIDQSLDALGIGFHRVAAPLVLFAAAARAGRIRIESHLARILIISRYNLFIEESSVSEPRRVRLPKAQWPSFDRFEHPAL